MRELKEHEIKLKDFLNAVHCYTEVVRIRVVGHWSSKYNKSLPSYDLSSDVFETKGKQNGSRDSVDFKRLMRLYGEAPVWNINASMEPFDWRGRVYCAVINANVKAEDIYEIALAEAEENRKAKRREYERNRRQKRKEVPDENA